MKAVNRVARSATKVASTLIEIPGGSLHKLILVAELGYAQQAMP